MSKQFNKVVQEWPELFNIKETIGMQDILCFSNKYNNYHIIKENTLYFVYQEINNKELDIVSWFPTLYGAINRAMKLINLK